MDSALRPHEDRANALPFTAYYNIFTTEFDGKALLLKPVQFTVSTSR